MIIALSHLIKNSTSPQQECNKFLAQGYRKKFAAIGIANNPEKEKFLKTFHKTHDLFFLEGIYPPIEVIQHNSKYGPSEGRFDLNDQDIKLNVADTASEIDFWNKILDFDRTETDGKNYLIKKLLFKEIRIEVCQSNINHDTYLDSQGLTTMAFFVRNIDTFYEKALTEPFCQHTEIFPLEINNNQFKILILKSINNAFIELMEPIK